MPDTKFSLPALREHLRKYFWIYLAGIVVCLILSNLLWTTTRPQVPVEQKVVVYMADSFSDPSALSDIARDALERTQPYDETLLELEFQSMMFNENDYTSAMLLMTRLAVGEGDLFFCSEAALNSIVGSGAALPLDDLVADGWLGQWELEPWYCTEVDEEGGETRTYLAALRIDKLTALASMGAFNNQGAYLVVASNGGNVETSLKAAEFIIEDLMEASDAQTDSDQPAA